MQRKTWVGPVAYDESAYASGPETLMTLKLVCLSCGQGNRVPETRREAGPKCGSCGTPLLSAAPVEVTLPILQKAIRIDTLLLVVDFWAEWCGPCRMMAPAFAGAAKTLGSRARFAKVDTQAHPEAGAIYGIRGIPLLIAFRNGGEVRRQVGALPQDAIVEWASGFADAHSADRA